MIRTTRSRLELRQEPDRAASAAGAVLAAVGAGEALIALGRLVAEYTVPVGRGFGGDAARLVLGVAFAASAWFFLRGRSRVIVDLDHRMVARYMGVGGQAVGGNKSWDLAEFVAVVLVRRERRRLLSGVSSRSEVVCLRRDDGTDLELYWGSGDGAQVAQDLARFAGLPCHGV